MANQSLKSLPVLGIGSAVEYHIKKEKELPKLKLTSTYTLIFVKSYFVSPVVATKIASTT